jgi:hypothetical protein
MAVAKGEKRGRYRTKYEAEHAANGYIPPSRAADILGRKPHRVYYLIYTERVRSRRYGGQLLVSLGDIEREKNNDGRRTQ